MDPPVESYADLLRNDDETLLTFRRKMIERGHFMLPINLKRPVITATHTDEDIDLTLRLSIP